MTELTDRDSTRCFVCGSEAICEHRERELVPHYRSLGLKTLTLPPVKYPVGAIREHREVVVPRKPPTIAHIARKRDSLGQGGLPRAARGICGYSGLRGW